MFRKKQKETGRNVQQQQNAAVFSYYKSRPNERTNKPRREEVPGRKFSFKWLAHIPSALLGAVILLCLVYVSTLDSKPIVRVVGTQADRRLVKNPSRYESQIQSIVESSIINRSKLLIDTENLANQIIETYPELGDVEVVMPLISRRPIVEIKPTEPTLVLSSINNETLVVDRNGRAISNAKDVESSLLENLPVVTDESNIALENGKVVLPSEAVVFISEIYKQLTNKKIPVESMVLPNIANELHLRVKGSEYYVKFDLKGEGRQQSGTFLAVKNHLESQKKTNIEYVDVRVPGKAYYK